VDIVGEAWLVLFGVFLLASALLNWDFMMKKENIHKPLDMVPRSLGRTIIGALGLMLFLIGLLSLLNVISIWR